MPRAEKLIADCTRRISRGQPSDAGSIPAISTSRGSVELFCESRCFPFFFCFSQVSEGDLGGAAEEPGRDGEGVWAEEDLVYEVFEE